MQRYHTILNYTTILFIVIFPHLIMLIFNYLQKHGYTIIFDRYCEYEILYLFLSL